MKENINYNFTQEIKNLINNSKKRIYSYVNQELIKTYFEIGRKIIEEEQKGKNRAEYGKYIIQNLSKELQDEFGKGFSRRNIENMRNFYFYYKNKDSQIWQTLSTQLSWSHFCELIKIKDDKKRKYFENYAINENLSVRDLKRQMRTLHYERLLINQNPLENKNNVREIIKDPYILDFLNIENNRELDIETKILDNLQKFILELGQGFSFIARQKRININNKNYFIDLLFYNIFLKCYVLIELKKGSFKHKDIGQINFYLNYIKNNINQKDDNEPIGIILCKNKNNFEVKFACENISNKLFISKYKLYLPKKEELLKEINKI